MTDETTRHLISSKFQTAAARTFSVVLTLATHFVITLVILLLVWALEFLMQRLSFDPLMFGKLPLSYVFDFIDFSVVLVFVALGTVETLKILAKSEP